MPLPQNPVPSTNLPQPPKPSPWWSKSAPFLIVAFVIITVAFSVISVYLQKNLPNPTPREDKPIVVAPEAIVPSGGGPGVIP